MRILHTNMLRGWGGQSNRILTEARLTRDAGHEVAFAVPHTSKLRQKALDLGFEAFPNYEFKPPAQVWKFLPDLRRFLRDVKAFRPDIIHLHGSQDTWLAVIAKPYMPRPRPILLRTKHNDYPWKRHRANIWMYNQVDAYMVISDFIEQQIVEYPGLAAKPRGFARSIPDLSRLTPPIEPMRRELNLPEGTFLWGSTGRLRPEKAHDITLRAFAKVHAAHPEARLIIAGDGSLGDQLRALRTELGLDGIATFLGFRQDVPAVLASLDGYVLASRLEGLGTAILEALAMGLPVVASRVGGIPDSVKDGKTGVLVPPEDPDALAAAMIDLMENPERRAALGRHAAEFVRTAFTQEQLQQRTLDLYQRLVEERET